MPFQCKLEIVTKLLARVGVMQAGVRISFRVAGIVQYLSGTANAGYATKEDTVIVDIPTPTIMQDGVTKLVVTTPSQNREDASLIAAIARGTCWFDDLTSGKASSISEIASRDNVTDSYVGRLLNLALLSPTIVHQVLDGCPRATEKAKREIVGQGFPSSWSKQAIIFGQVGFIYVGH